MSQIRMTAPAESSLPEWRRMRQALWPEMADEDNAQETQAMMAAAERFFIRIAADEDGKTMGFVEATLRKDYVNGCATTPVTFLEGIYVEPWARRRGVARSMVHAVEEWARRLGCREFASDALLENHSSHAMHAALGFEETERVVCFKKDVA